MTGGTILAIDTSSATASVAVYADRVLSETTWHSGRRHSAQLLPAIDDTLSRAGIDKKKLSAIAVAAGPGSYSGLRVGVSTAMSMALALDLALAQVPTLDVIACAHLGCLPSTRGDGATKFDGPTRGGGSIGRTIRAAIEVGRDHFATASYRSDGHLEHEAPIERVGLGELLELAAAERSLLAVDLDPETRETIEHQYGERVELASPGASARRAGFLAELAAMKIRRGELVGDLAVEPIYLHN